MSQNDWVIRIGADEYRAPSIETIREWVESGRVPLTAFIRNPETNNWGPVSDVPELVVAARRGPAILPTHQQQSPTKSSSSGCAQGCLVLLGIGAALLILVAIISAISPEKAASPSGASGPSTSGGGPGWRPALGHLWTGVKLCDATSHEAVFEVMGGNEKYLAPDGRRIRGLKVKYPDGTIEWKDRDWIVDSGQFLVRADDPALARKSWEVYEY